MCGTERIASARRQQRPINITNPHHLYAYLEQVGALLGVT